MNDEMFKRNVTMNIYFHLVKLAMRGQTTTYIDIAVEFGLPSTGNQLNLSPIMYDIYRFCESVSQPALTSIVVRKSGSEMGLPGPGFWSLYSPSHEHLTKKSKRDIVTRFHKAVFDYWGSFSTPIVEEVTEVIEEVKPPRYYVDINRCNCHPETCCCDDYAVYDRGVGLLKDAKAKKVTTAFFQSSANEIAEAFNKSHEAEGNQHYIVDITKDNPLC